MSNKIQTHILHSSRSKDGVIRKVILRECLEFVTFDGLYMEFGVWKGFTINFIADLCPTKVIYGFDSWNGLPEDWVVSKQRVIQKGSFSLNGTPPSVRNNVKLIHGMFDETLPLFAETVENNNIAFIHIDCDLYSSTKTIFQYLGHLFAPGTVIVFDEYYQGIGEKQAFDEWLDSTDMYASMIRSTVSEQAGFVLHSTPTAPVMDIDTKWYLERTDFTKLVNTQH